MKWPLLLILLCLSLNIYANDEVKAICHLAHSLDKKQSSPIESFSFFKRLLIKTFPQLYIGVNSVTSPEENQIHQHQFIIFTIGKINNKNFELDAEWKRVEKKTKGNPWLYLFKAQDEEECIINAEKIGLTDELATYQAKKQDSEINAKKLIKDTEKIIKRYQENFTIVPYESWEEISEYIRNLPDNKYDFIVTFHGDKDGRFYDYNRAPIITNLFFKPMMEKANSFTYFSCYPEKSQNYYKNFFGKFQEKNIQIYFPKLKKQLKQSEKIPMLLFKDFIPQVFEMLGVTSIEQRTSTDNF